MTRHKRPKVERETLSFIAAARRFIRAAGTRVANGDEPELAALLSLQADLDAAIQVAVDGQRAVGRSWAHIALATGTSRQAAFKRWGGREADRVELRNAINAEEAIRRGYMGGQWDPENGFRPLVSLGQPGEPIDVNSMYPAALRGRG